MDTVHMRQKDAAMLQAVFISEQEQADDIYRVVQYRCVSFSNRTEARVLDVFQTT